MLFLKKYSLLPIVLLMAIAMQAQDNKDWKLLKPKDNSKTKRVEEKKQPGTGKVVPSSDSLVKPGTITIHQDERIDELLREYDDAEKVLTGYRIQIFLGKAKEAERMRTKFIVRHPDIPAYNEWQAPNRKIRVGDFRTKLDAERALLDIKKEYPGAYIVEDEIELPPLGIPKEDQPKSRKI